MNYSLQRNLITELRNANLKITSARLGVLAAFEQADFPLDAISLINYLKKNKIKANRVTVFRIINILMKKGLVKSIQFNESKLRYEHTNKIDHHHFICETCGKIEDVLGCSIDNLEKKLRQKKGLKIKHHSLEFFGLCLDCQK